MAAAISDRIAARVAVHDLLMEAEPWDGPRARQWRSWRHIVLTSRAPLDREARFDPDILRARVRAVRGAVTSFWRHTRWGKQRRDPETGRKRSRRDTSYVVGQEIAPGGMVHAHMLVFGEFAPQSILEGIWSEALGEEALVYVTTVHDNAGIASALREVLKYTTKGEKGARDQPRHAAAVELAFRNVKRISVGGALRRVNLAETDGQHDDGLAADLHDYEDLACVGCGSLGPWKWEGPVSAKAVTENGGFGYFGPAPGAVS